MIVRRVIFQLLAVGRKMLTVDGNPTREAEVRAALNIQFVQTSVHISLIAADHPRDIGGLDAAAGCEFVDDRIRQLE
jgi:hypothetical protein